MNCAFLSFSIEKQTVWRLPFLSFSIEKQRQLSLSLQEKMFFFNLFKTFGKYDIKICLLTNFFYFVCTLMFQIAKQIFVCKLTSVNAKKLF